jgi:hypothetical protein
MNIFNRDNQWKKACYKYINRDAFINLTIISKEGVIMKEKELSIVPSLDNKLNRCINNCELNIFY